MTTAHSRAPPCAQYIWIVLRLFQAVDAHSGYDFPWSLRHLSTKYLPWLGWAGADHHDYHHEQTKGCYSTSFRHMDYLFGTEYSYHEKRAAQKAARDQAAHAKKQKGEQAIRATDKGSKAN